METMITLTGVTPGTTLRAPWILDTDQGKMRIWPQSHGIDRPEIELIRNGILKQFMISYSEKDESYNGKTYRNKYIETVTPATGQETNVPSAEMQSMQQVAQAAPPPAPEMPRPQVQTTPSEAIDYESLPIPLQALAKSLLEGGHARTVLEALTHAEVGIRAFQAGQRWEWGLGERHDSGLPEERW